MRAAVAESVRHPGRDQRVVHGQRKWCRDIEFPAEFAHVSEAHRKRCLVADAHLSGGREWKALVREIVLRHRLQESPRDGALDVQYGVRVSDVGHHTECIRWDVAADPRLDVRLREGCRDHEKSVRRKARDS